VLLSYTSLALPVPGTAAPLKCGGGGVSCFRIFERYLMREIPEPLLEALTQGAAKLCHVWMIARRDSAVLAFSDHDRPLRFLGHDTEPQSAVTRGAIEAGIGVAASSQALSGLINSEAIRAEDIRAGLYDEADISLYVVDWTAPEHYVLIGSGRMARLEIEGGLSDLEGRFIAHIEGLSARLERVIGRRFSRTCDAALGDARCGLTEALPAPTCDKTYGTCRDVFDNLLNFRGFPDLPGEDVLSLYPRAGDMMDGAVRRMRA
jgi:hypothetical protein